MTEEETLIILNIPDWLLKKLHKDKGNLVLNDFIIEIIKEWYEQL